MNKIFFSIVLAVLLLNLVGCYRTEILNPKEFINYKHAEGKPSEIYVITHDSLVYHFDAEDYSMINYTLEGTGTQIINNSEIPFKGKIPFTDINHIKWQVIDDKSESMLIVGGISAAAVLIGVGVQNSNVKFFDSQR